jgi:hypothetical protein
MQKTNLKLSYTISVKAPKKLNNRELFLHEKEETLRKKLSEGLISEVQFYQYWQIVKALHRSDSEKSLRIELSQIGQRERLQRFKYGTR